MRFFVDNSLFYIKQENLSRFKCSNLLHDQKTHCHILLAMYWVAFLIFRTLLLKLITKSVFINFNLIWTWSSPISLIVLQQISFSPCETWRKNKDDFWKNRYCSHTSRKKKKKKSLTRLAADQIASSDYFSPCMPFPMAGLFCQHKFPAPLPILSYLSHTDTLVRHQHAPPPPTFNTPFWAVRQKANNIISIAARACPLDLWKRRKCN